MKIQFASDLHYEFFDNSIFLGFRPAPDADVLVLSGDIVVHPETIRRFADWPVPVVYVHGNHELYACKDFDERIQELRDACRGTTIHFLEKDRLVLNGVRFLGTALWTDYLLFGPTEQASTMAECQYMMSDHWRIVTQQRIFQPADALQRHTESRFWLESQLNETYAGTTVVVTHHAPHPRSVETWTKDKIAKAAYASNLTELMDKAELWIHGHIHTSADYYVGRTRVMSNPRGYPITKTNSFKKVYQNSAYKPELIVNV
jgi:Icc-related predicted phosphoesterase